MAHLPQRAPVQTLIQAGFTVTDAPTVAQYLDESGDDEGAAWLGASADVLTALAYRDTATAFATADGRVLITAIEPAYFVARCTTPAELSAAVKAVTNA